MLHCMGRGFAMILPAVALLGSTTLRSGKRQNMGLKLGQRDWMFPTPGKFHSGNVDATRFGECDLEIDNQQHKQLGLVGHFRCS